MTHAPRDFSDEDLTAFLDGEAPVALASEIAQRMEADPTLAARVASLDIPLPRLKAAFDAQLVQAPALPLLPAANTVAPQHASNRGWLQGVLGLGAGLAAGLALAMSFGWTSPTTPSATPQPMGWLDAVATYQMLYGPETLSNAEAQNPSVLASLSDVVDLDLTALNAVEGLEFLRAQRLNFKGKALIQLAYALPDGTPFAICILQSDTAAQTAQFKELQGLQAANWTTGGHGILLIGGTDADTLKALTPRVQALL